MACPWSRRQHPGLHTENPMDAPTEPELLISRGLYIEAEPPPRRRTHQPLRRSAGPQVANFLLALHGVRRTLTEHLVVL